MLKKGEFHIFRMSGVFYYFLYSIFLFIFQHYPSKPKHIIPALFRVV